MKNKDTIRDFDAETETSVYAAERLVANIAVNARAAEDAAFGRLQVGDEVPAELYLQSAGLEHLLPLTDDDTDGYIIKNGKIAEYEISELFFDIYRSNIDRIFEDAPKRDADCGDDVDICRYTDGLYEYLKALYATFEEIMSEKISTAQAGEASSDADEKGYAELCRLVSAIGQKRLEVGAPADDYVKGVEASSNALVLLEKRGGRYVIKNADRDSTDYKLILFSCFKLSDDSNAALFAVKLRQWHARTAK